MWKVGNIAPVVCWAWAPRMGSTSLRSATSRSSFLLTRRRPQPKQPQHMFGWLSKKPLGCDPMVSASLAARTIALEMERDVGGMGQPVPGQLLRLLIASLVRLGTIKQVIRDASHR